MFSPPEATAKLRFREAATLWHDSRRLSLKPRTWEMYGHYISVLERFFGNIVLDQIHIGHFVRYQKWRMDCAGPSAINHELNTLAQILDAAGLWGSIKKHYHPLPLPRWTPPRVMSEEEENRLFETAASNPRWAVAYWVASITNNTSASGCELRGLQLRHVDLFADPPVIYVPSDSVKNEYRARVIPLNDRGVIQMQRIVERAQSLGSTRPEHYVFPLRVKKGVYDPARPASASFIKKSFHEMRDAAGLPWLRPHDLRHQVITKMLESGAPEQTVMSIAGHVSRQMLEHYSHQRVAAKKQVLDLINPDVKHFSRCSPSVAPASRNGVRPRDLGSPNQQDPEGRGIGNSEREPCAIAHDNESPRRGGKRENQADARPAPRRRSYRDDPLRMSPGWFAVQQLRSRQGN